MKKEAILGRNGFSRVYEDKTGDAWDTLEEM
jgi:hypothetical protein